MLTGQFVGSFPGYVSKLFPENIGCYILVSCLGRGGGDHGHRWFRSSKRGGTTEITPPFEEQAFAWADAPQDHIALVDEGDCLTLRTSKGRMLRKFQLSPEHRPFTVVELVELEDGSLAAHRIRQRVGILSELEVSEIWRIQGNQLRLFDSWEYRRSSFSPPRALLTPVGTDLYCYDFELDEVVLLGGYGCPMILPENLPAGTELMPFQGFGPLQLGGQTKLCQVRVRETESDRFEYQLFALTPYTWELKANLGSLVKMFDTEWRFLLGPSEEELFSITVSDGVACSVSTLSAFHVSRELHVVAHDQTTSSSSLYRITLE